MSGKVVLSRYHVRSANGTAKTMSGRTPTTMAFLFGRIGRPRLRLIHCKTQSSNIYRGRAFIRGHSVASRWGFQNRPTLVPREVITSSEVSSLNQNYYFWLSAHCSTGGSMTAGTTEHAPAVEQSVQVTSVASSDVPMAVEYRDHQKRDLNFRRQ